MIGYSRKKKKSRWEEIDEETSRLKVPNGWLIHRTVRLPCGHRGTGSAVGSTPENMKSDLEKDSLYTISISTSMTFIVDQTHQWDLKKD